MLDIPFWMYLVVGVIIAVVVIIGAVKSMYTVVPPDECHIVVSRSKGRKVFSTREKSDGSAYWKIPIVQQRVIVPLENIQLEVDKIPLRDVNMAKFVGDVVAWVNIDNPLLAAERLGELRGLESIKKDIFNVIRAVTRNESMGSTIIDIMKNRKDFSDRVKESVNKELDEWGMRVVELEVIHFIDESPYTVITDLEKRQSSIINADTRKLVATQEKEASIVESTATKDSTVVKAQNEKTYREKQIETNEAIGIREQQKEQKTAEETKKANEKKVESEKAMIVGTANYEKLKKVVEAEGEAEKTRKEGQAKADVAKMQGTAEAEVIRQKLYADADGTMKKADAYKAFNEAGIGLEVIKAYVSVKTVQAEQISKALQAAKIHVFSGGDSEGILGLKTGFNAGGLQQIGEELGINIKEIIENIGKNTVPVTDPADIASKATKILKKGT